MPSCNYWVFREGRRRAAGASVRSGLVLALQQLRAPNRETLVDALLRAGELETALADCGSEDAGAAAAITNALAAALVGLWPERAAFDSLSLVAARLRVPQEVEVSTPEGFAYYCLHPLVFARLAERTEITAGWAAVIGIRSIGATLSAVITASLAGRGVRAQRITVRPTGHPFDRKTEFTAEQLRWIAALRSHGADFLVVDEGPGLSGSSFLSVGDALLEAGVERRRIRLLCSREPDPDGLCTPRGAERWRAFQAHWPAHDIPHLPCEAADDWSAGEWRRRLYAAEAEWPASWVHMERTKFLSRDGNRLFKFAGYGRFGSPIDERARLLTGGGFGPEFFGLRDGFAEYGLLPGRPARPHDLSRAVIDRIADYCAWRAGAFRVRAADPGLTAMARFNYEKLVGEPAPRWLHLEHRAHVLCDAHMQPQEWLLADEFLPRKTDADSHGDDHFFPGPCDIAWDLAGAIVEWEMPGDAAAAMLRRYASRTGDDAGSRIRAYTTAYAAFRAGYCFMGASALQGTAEAQRLSRAAAHYQRALQLLTSPDSRAARTLSPPALLAS